jgi:formylglycine-generating enzyme required for sulfatase activity
LDTFPKVETGGGAYVDGELRAGTFIGRDQIVVLSGYTGEQLAGVLARLREILATGAAELRADVRRGRLTVTAPDAPRVVLSEAAAESLALAASREADEAAYLAALQVHPRYGRWATQFVPLAGVLTTVARPPGWRDVPQAFTLLEVEGEGAQRRVRRVPVDDVIAPLDDYEVLVLLGEPGSGKTTALYRTALAAAQARLAGRDGGRIPLYISLADDRGYGAPHDLVAARWRQMVGNDALVDHLRRGELLLLLDALNEMPFRDDRDYRARVQAWRRWVQQWPGNRVLFTCRSLDYSEPLGFHQVEIERLDDARVRDFLARYLPDHAGAAWEHLRESPLLELVRNPYYLWMLTYLVSQGGAWPTRRATLFRGFVRVLCRREQARDHPDWPGAPALMDALSALGASLQPLGQGTRLPRSEIEQRLRRAAPGLAPEAVVRLGLAATLLDCERAPKRVPGRAPNRAGVDGVEGEEVVRFFHHQVQEYFAARAIAQRFEDGEDLADRWRRPRLRGEMPDPGPLDDNEPLPPPPTTGWEEPTVLAAGLVDDPAAFVAAVNAVNPALAARCVAEGLGADAAPETAGPEVAAPETVAAVQASLLREMEDPRVHLRARIAAGAALGRLGDPRFEAVEAAGDRVLLPPLVAVPGGSFKMGSRRLAVAALALRGFTAARDEMPRHTVTWPPFYIGRYPVTNAEYACFIAAGGYEDAAYWPTAAARAWLRGEEAGESGAVRQWLELWRRLQADTASTLRQLERSGVTPRLLESAKVVAGMTEDELRAALQDQVAERSRVQPAYWDDARFNGPSQPVVGVTWFEALAYTRWLEKQLNVEGCTLKVWKRGEMADVNLEPSTFNVQLPSEAEWALAARGRRGRRYGWGRRWDQWRANTWEGHVLRTTPVGVYPQGRTPEGIEDVTGNVWAWTRSLYQPYPYVVDGREDLEADGYRVLRGGCWVNDPRYARCAYRVRYRPVNFVNDVGLRVVVSLARSGY